jgi:glycosyltransferase involved in cell wall biosynthesis
MQDNLTPSFEHADTAVTFSDDGRLPRISVIIPTYNEEKMLDTVLTALGEVDYPRDQLEIIVIDNGSTDGTVEVASAHGAKVFGQPELRVSGLRNFGAKQSCGEVLAFLDADCLPASDWLQSALASLKIENCVTGATYEVPANGIWIETAWFSQEPNGRRPVTHINSGNLIVSRDLFVAIGGFNEELISGEDYEFCQRAWEVTRVIADDSIRTIHLGNPKTLKKFMKREIWHGLGALGSLKRDWKDKPFFGTLAFLVSCILQVIGVIAWSTPFGARFFFTGCLCMILVIFATIFYRLRSFADIVLVSRLAILYFLYYLSRSIALVLLAWGQKNYRRSR